VKVWKRQGKVEKTQLAETSDKAAEIIAQISIQKEAETSKELKPSKNPKEHRSLLDFWKRQRNPRENTS